MHASIFTFQVPFWVLDLPTDNFNSSTSSNLAISCHSVPTYEQCRNVAKETNICHSVSYNTAKKPQKCATTTPRNLECWRFAGVVSPPKVGPRIVQRVSDCGRSKIQDDNSGRLNLHLNINNPQSTSKYWQPTIYIWILTTHINLQYSWIIFAVGLRVSFFFWSKYPLKSDVNWNVSIFYFGKNIKLLKL